MEIQNDISKRHPQIPLLNIGFFTKPSDKNLYIIIKKLDKIGIAIAMVAQVMDPKSLLVEPLESHAFATIANGYSLFQKRNLAKEDLIALASQVEHLGSLITRGSITKQISSMNADILLAELGKVGTLLHAEIETFLPLAMGPVLEDAPFEALVKQTESKRHQQVIKTTFINDIKKEPIKQEVSDERADRKQEILSVIRSRTVSTLADIKSLVTAYSEKTIQRDLNEMVEMGVIKKEGNKRWTTYKIA